MIASLILLGLWIWLNSGPKPPEEFVSSTEPELSEFESPIEQS